MSKTKKKPVPIIPQGPNKRMQKDIEDLRKTVHQLVLQNNGHVDRIEDLIERQGVVEALGAKLLRVAGLLKTLPELKLPHDLSEMPTPNMAALDENFDTLAKWGKDIAAALKELNA